MIKKLKYTYYQLLYRIVGHHTMSELSYLTKLVPGFKLQTNTLRLFFQGDVKKFYKYAKEDGMTDRSLTRIECLVDINVVRAWDEILNGVPYRCIPILKEDA